MADNIVFPQHGDLPDAALFAFARGTPTTGAIVSGFQLNGNFSAPEVTVSEGKGLVDRGTFETQHPDIDPSKTVKDAIAVVQADTETISLSGNAVNHIYLDADVGADDTPTIRSNTTNSAPSSAAVKIGEVDTSSNTVSQQWRLLSGSGNLTFPSQSAADSAADRLEEGTLVYNRAEDRAFITVGNSITQSPFDDGIPDYTDSDAISAVDGEVSVASNSVSGLDSTLDTVSGDLSAHVSAGNPHSNSADQNHGNAAHSATFETEGGAQTRVDDHESKNNPHSNSADQNHGNASHSATFETDVGAQNRVDNHENKDNPHPGSADTNHGNESHSNTFATSADGFDIQKNGTDGSGIINFKTQ